MHKSTNHPPHSKPADNAPPDSAREWPWRTASGRRLALAALFGLVFGFLLQKGGVAKFDILVGVLLLENFVVIKVMLSAIIVGMIGVYLLRRAGVLETKRKETVLGANIIGGLVFGLGFGLIAYCPGTNAAAIGQGNYDALVGALGMIVGSYLFALNFGFLQRTVSRWGRKGVTTLPDLFKASPGSFILFAAPLLFATLVLIEYLD